MTTDKQFKVGGKAVRTRDACIDATLGDVLDITSMNKFAIGGINQRTDTWQVWSPGQCEPAEQDQPLSARVAELEAELAKAKAALAVKDKPEPGPPKDGFVWVRKTFFNDWMFWGRGDKVTLINYKDFYVGIMEASEWVEGPDWHRIPLAALCDAIGKLCEESDQ